jgi:hypothetical protein
MRDSIEHDGSLKLSCAYLYLILKKYSKFFWKVFKKIWIGCYFCLNSCNKYIAQIARSLITLRAQNQRTQFFSSLFINFPKFF